ncbi:MAG: hypothetical protein HFG03_05525 [Oscillibacter sp.]|jgi:hypothetical protein|nr:hypothetical protein [Oscillibacter sp.]
MPKKRVCVTLTEKDCTLLSQMAQDTMRSPAGYLRWLLHRHLAQPEEPEEQETARE